MHDSPRHLLQATIKVNLPWEDYARRGLRFTTAVLDEATVWPVMIGGMIVVFDKDLEFTQHRVVERTEEYVVLGGAVPWPREGREGE